MSKAFKKAVSAILGLTLCAGMCACNQTQPGTSASGEPDASGAVEASGTDADAGAACRPHGPDRRSAPRAQGVLVNRES